MEKQSKYAKLPYKLTDTIKVIDAFVCSGSRFGLSLLTEVLVEICESNCANNTIWANIYHVADSEIPVSIITVSTHSIFLTEHHTL